MNLPELKQHKYCKVHMHCVCNGVVYNTCACMQMCCSTWVYFPLSQYVHLLCIIIIIMMVYVCVQGLLSLTNGTRIEGAFGGSWQKKIEIIKATLEDGDKVQEDTDSAHVAIAELQ